METKQQEGDPFDRQKSIRGWENDVLANSTCLVLGVGGLGTSVCLALARLGVSRLIFLDRDDVDVTNLNRQILFTRHDVGRRKVDAAADGILRHAPHDIVIEKNHADALAEWAWIVGKAKTAQVIFNCVDIGGHFDFAVLTLCKSLGIPYVSGSSYSSSVICEFFTGHPQHFSYSLQPGDLREEVVSQCTVTTIQLLPNALFIPTDPKPDTRNIGSSILVAGTCGFMMVNSWVQALMAHQVPTNPPASSSVAPSTLAPAEEEEVPLEPVPNFIKFEVCAYWEDGGVSAFPMQTIE